MASYTPLTRQASYSHSLWRTTYIPIMWSWRTSIKCLACGAHTWLVSCRMMIKVSTQSSHLIVAENGTTWPGPRELSVKTKVRWDEQRLYFFTAAQTGQVAKPMPFKWAWQLGHFEQQYSQKVFGCGYRCILNVFRYGYILTAFSYGYKYFQWYKYYQISWICICIQICIHQRCSELSSLWIINRINSRLRWLQSSSKRQVYLNLYIPTETSIEILKLHLHHQVYCSVNWGALCLMWWFAMLERSNVAHDS